MTADAISVAGWRTVVRVPDILAAVLIAGYAVLQMALASRAGFAPASNDTLALVTMSQGIAWNDPSTLHNGFFPLGLPAILAMLSPGWELPATGALSILAGVLALASVHLITRTVADAWCGLLAIVALAADPLFFAYFASPGPDMPSLGLALAGIAVYTLESRRGPEGIRTWVVVTSGVAIGCAGLFRYHAALLAVGLVTWAALHARARPRLLLAAIGGLVLGYGPQLVANVLGGFGPLESASGFTFYQSVVDINWHATGSLDPAAYGSVVGIVMEHPLDFATRYLESLTRYAMPVALVAAATLLRRRGRSPAVMASLLAAVTAYSVIVATGNSPRGLLPAVSLGAVGLGVIAYRACAVTRPYAGPRTRGIAIGLLVGSLLVLPNAAQAASEVDTRLSLEASRAAVEAELADLGLIDDAREILTNDFNFYLSDAAGVNPDKIGGWPDISLNGNQPHRSVRVDSVANFSCDARERGIRLVLWSPGGIPGMHPELEAALNGASRTSLLRNAGQVGPYVVTLVQPGYPC